MYLIQDLKENQKTILVLIVVFFFGISTGLALYSSLKEETRELAEEFRKLIGEGSQFETAVNILFKNIQSSLLTLILGPTIIVPALIVYANGLAAGLIIQLAHEGGKSYLMITLGLLAHGVIELGVFFLTAAAGMRITIEAIKPSKESRKESIIAAVKDALRIYITITIPLLILAAFIETYISIQIIN